jgi:Zn-dependent peptidase ImmA (M78 family)/transcriptional regulator with XRE-family HTH domain
MREERGAAARRPLPKPIPERIKEAREARGFTLEAFADALSVSRQAVAQYETGIIAPSGEVMSTIINVTEQPLSFFTSVPARTGELTSAFWRSLKRMGQHHRRRIVRRLQWASDVAALVERFIDLPDVNLPQIEFDPDLHGEEEIERAAEVAREHWKLGKGPLSNLAITLEENGIVLIRESANCEDMDAVSAWSMGRPFILLDNDVEGGPRDLFNLAHELGHVLLHTGIEIDSSNLTRIERQADRFAGAFLLPRDTFPNEVFGSSLDHFKFLKKRWGVSIQAMIYRCKNLGLLSDNQVAYLFKQINSHRIRKHEPLDDAFPVNKPTMLGGAIKMIVEHGVYTRNQIEDDLRLNMRDVESLCGVPKGFLDARVVRMQFKRPVGSGLSTT